MREIKFRAWDITSNSMIIGIHIFINGPGVIWINNRDGLEGEDNLISTKNLIIQQSTGLKDKNGKEIYEGDIIKNFAIRDSVIFEKGVFTTIMSHNDQFNVKQPLAVHSEIEIIGNIYENPELLK